MFEGRKVLVTGGGGFIGSHLVERLVERGAGTTTVDRRGRRTLSNLAAVADTVAAVQFDLVQDDLADFLAGSKFDLIFHLAASTDHRGAVGHPKEDFEQNGLATLNLLEAVRNASPTTELVHVSSALIYSGGENPLAEDARAIPETPYGISKLAAESYVRVYASLHGLRTVVARPFAVFGPRLRRHVIYEIIDRLIHDPACLSMRGDGTEVRDFAYVSDVVDALLLLAERAPKNGQAYNVASGQHVSIGKLVRLIADTMGVAPVVAYSGPERSETTSELRAHIGRLKALGYVPQVNLAEGIRHTVAWATARNSLEI